MYVDLLHIEHGRVAIDQVKHMPVPSLFGANDGDIVFTLDTYVPENESDFDVDEYEQHQEIYLLERKSVTKAQWHHIYSEMRFQGLNAEIKKRFNL